MSKLSTIDFFRKTEGKSALIAILGTILIIGMISLAITPERYDLRIGQIAPKTITATKDVEDLIATAKKRETAIKNIEPSYHRTEDVQEKVIEDFKEIFEKLKMVQIYGENILEQKGKEYVFSKEDLTNAKNMVLEIPFTDVQIKVLLYSDEEKLSVAYSETQIALESAYLSGVIREEKEIEAIQSLQRLIGVKTDTSMLLYVITPVLQQVVKPNFIIDEEGTEKIIQTASEALEPVIYNKGQNIVVSGEKIEENQLEMLRTLGLLSDRQVNLKNYLGAILLAAMIMGIGWVLLGLLALNLRKNVRKFSVFILVIVITLGVTIITMKINKNIIPIYMGTLLLASLLGKRAGIIGNVILSFLVSLVVTGGSAVYSTEMTKTLITSLTGGTIAVFVLRSKPQRTRVLLAGLCAAISDLIMVFGIGMMVSNDLYNVLQNGLSYALGGMLGAVLALAFQPIFEAIFNLATPSKLLELANPRHPLLKRLLLEAPGTYYHSIVVANLAEAAADAIGANGLLVRAAAYFHDIGKLKRPRFFKENQHGLNSHDKLEPHVSASIILAHAGDGLALAKQYRLPEEIQQATVEHHGDGLVNYFYHKAVKEMKEDEKIKETDYRYSGPIPTSKENAIIMLADTVEAAVRSLQEPTPNNIRNFILDLVRGKIADGQLSNSMLTLKDIDVICESFIKVLNGIYHERVEYPTDAPINRSSDSIGQMLQSKEEDPSENLPENTEKTIEHIDKEKNEKETSNISEDD